MVKNTKIVKLANEISRELTKRNLINNYNLQVKLLQKVAEEKSLTPHELQALVSELNKQLLLAHYQSGAKGKFSPIKVEDVMQDSFDKIFSDAVKNIKTASKVDNLDDFTRPNVKVGQIQATSRTSLDKAFYKNVVKRRSGVVEWDDPNFYTDQLFEKIAAEKKKLQDNKYFRQLIKTASDAKKIRNEISSLIKTEILRDNLTPFELRVLMTKIAEEVAPQTAEELKQAVKDVAKSIEPVDQEKAREVAEAAERPMSIEEIEQYEIEILDQLMYLVSQLDAKVNFIIKLLYKLSGLEQPETKEKTNSGEVEGEGGEGRAPASET